MQPCNKPSRDVISRKNAELMIHNVTVALSATHTHGHTDKHTFTINTRESRVEISSVSYMSPHASITD